MKNIGKIDKIIRLVLGVVLFSLFFLLDGNWKFLGLIGFIPTITALINFCPLYSIFGIHTNKK
jgi:hypothetical protein